MLEKGCGPKVLAINFRLDFLSSGKNKLRKYPYHEIIISGPARTVRVWISMTSVNRVEIEFLLPPATTIMCPIKEQAGFDLSVGSRGHFEAGIQPSSLKGPTTFVSNSRMP